MKFRFNLMVKLDLSVVKRWYFCERANYYKSLRKSNFSMVKHRFRGFVLIIETINLNLLIFTRSSQAVKKFQEFVI